MSDFPFVPDPLDSVRKDPLGPARVNLLNTNIRVVDELARTEHFADGQHNAAEVPWVLGHVADGSTPTGYLFNTGFGGGTLARPATGEYTVNAVSGVVPTSVSGDLQFAAMANVADSAIDSKPHVISVEAVSATSFKARIHQLSSTLAAPGNTWAAQNRSFDFGLHATAKNGTASLLTGYTPKLVRDFLTEQATDWNVLVKNQSIVRASALLEHTIDGEHASNRIANAVGWFKPNGSTYDVLDQVGVKGVSKVGAGIIEVTLNGFFTSTNVMACFPSVQPLVDGEFVVINGRAYSGTKFRFFIYAYSVAEGWVRADRSFFAPMFGGI